MVKILYTNCTKDYYAPKKKNINICLKISNYKENLDSKNYNIKNKDIINKKNNNITLKNNLHNLIDKVHKIVI